MLHIFQSVYERANSGSIGLGVTDTETACSERTKSRFSLRLGFFKALISKSCFGPELGDAAAVEAIAVKS